MGSTKNNKIILIHPFDSHSGSQRVVATLARVFFESGDNLKIFLGFGTEGFVSEISGVSRFSRINNVLIRKYLYPIWILIMWPRMIISVIRREIVWANTVYSIPAVLPMVLFAPRHLIIHAHEIQFPKVLNKLLYWASKRNVMILAVSHLHLKRLGLKATILPNCVEVDCDAQETDTNVVIYVGNPSLPKGFPLFVDVAKRLQGRDFSLIAYVPYRTKAVDEILRTAEEAGVQVKVGYTNPLEIYSGASLLLQCSDPSFCTETFSLVSVEAVCCGVPVATAGMEVAGEVLGEALAFDEPTRNPDKIAHEITVFLASSDMVSKIIRATKLQRLKYGYETFRDGVKCIIEMASYKDDDKIL
jgi:glycosyltransferase involved in cell wall biosynthesis